ncbi:MAG TPA: type III pantothenate kinase [Burkholderiales bacterium]|nr:type III pantothenate kinase [Burkholderiales bacterium]
MHILAVDAGNSRIKWGLWDGSWSRQDSVATAEVAALGAAWRALPPLRFLAVCSVAAAPVVEWLDAWARSHGVAVRRVSSQREQCGVRNGYCDPGQLGADRWAALIAARHITQGAALTVNAGTAVTIDALTHEGEFLGGLIMPGLDLMADSLAGGTAGLPRAHGAVAQFPRNTADAIASGAVQSVCGAVERMERALAKCSAVPRILLSGGAAQMIHAHLGRPARLVPNLVLEGLRIIAADEGGG